MDYIIPKNFKVFVSIPNNIWNIIPKIKHKIVVNTNGIFDIYEIAIANKIVSSNNNYNELGNVILDPNLGRKNNDQITICDYRH